MSGTLDKRPEFLILIAVLVALVLGIVVSVASCGMLAGAAGSAAQGSHPGIYSDDWEEWLDQHMGDDGYTGDQYYTEKDVPGQMDIDVPELQDDLQAMINRDLQESMNLKDKDVTITELTKDEVGKPELRNGQVLCQVKGKATIKNADGQTGTVDYTSYYFADDPTAEKIIWYIYGYDLSSYDLLPAGAQEKCGDPLYLRDTLLGDGSGKLDLSRDQGRDARTA